MEKWQRREEWSQLTTSKSAVQTSPAKPLTASVTKATRRSFVFWRSKLPLSSCGTTFHSAGDSYMYKYTHWHTAAGMVLSASHRVSHSRMWHSPPMPSPWRRPVWMPAVCDRVWLATDWLVLQTCDIVWGTAKILSLKPFILVLGLEIFPAQLNFFLCTFWRSERTDLKVEICLSLTRFRAHATQVGHFLQESMHEMQKRPHKGWCDSPSVKKVSWLVYQWLTQGKLSRFYICRVCLSVHPSPSVQLSHFEVTWRDCISVCLQDCFQDDVIHPPVCHPTDCHKELSVCLSVSLTDNQLHSQSDSCRLSPLCKRWTVRSGFWVLGVFGWLIMINDVRSTVTPVQMTGEQEVCDIFVTTNSNYYWWGKAHPCSNVLSL